MIQGHPFIQEMKDACDGCALRKHHQQSFPREVA
jgi:hypothetical protein